MSISFLSSLPLYLNRNVSSPETGFFWAGRVFFTFLFQPPLSSDRRLPLKWGGSLMYLDQTSSARGRFFAINNFRCAFPQCPPLFFPTHTVPYQRRPFFPQNTLPLLPLQPTRPSPFLNDGTNCFQTYRFFPGTFSFSLGPFPSPEGVPSRRRPVVLSVFLF